MNLIITVEMKLVFATNNLNKLSEIQSLISRDIEILSLKDINCFEELPETNPTIEKNALQKAKYVFDNYGFNCFADDTGLEVESLNGDPGVYSARYAGEDCNTNDNINKLLYNLKNKSNRGARFRTVIALIVGGKEKLFEGECNGVITNLISGNEGFGYDPIFMPLGFNKTFAEMTKDEKGQISHRSRAVIKLVDFLRR